MRVDLENLALVNHLLFVLCCQALAYTMRPLLPTIWAM
jgi:hypothetical protein